MVNDLFIVTGASRGLGLAMAEQLLSPTHHVLCLSRHVNPALVARATELNSPLTHLTVDLGTPLEGAKALHDWLAEPKQQPRSSATLINNAGLIPPIGPLSSSNPADLSDALRIGLEAPMLLTAVFLQAVDSWNVQRKVLNVSSGLGRRAMASQSAYCAAKAGLDHFTRCLALDEARKGHGAKVCSLAPGVIDTDMQHQLRHAKDTDFPDLQTFRGLKDGGHLSSPSDAAKRVLGYLFSPNFGDTAVADVRH